MKKVIIIGAGPAGLTAGYELVKDGNEDYEVVILEESQDIGGISKTVKYKDNRMDIGGHRFFSKSDEIMKFWEELMPIQGEDSFDDKKLNMGVDKRWTWRNNIDITKKNLSKKEQVNWGFLYV